MHNWAGGAGESSSFARMPMQSFQSIPFHVYYDIINDMKKHLKDFRFRFFIRLLLAFFGCCGRCSIPFVRLNRASHASHELDASTYCCRCLISHVCVCPIDNSCCHNGFFVVVVIHQVFFSPVEDDLSIYVYVLYTRCYCEWCWLWRC